MAIQYKKHFTQDLTKDVEIRQNCGQIVFNKDNLSEIISVDVFDNGQPVTITGSVAGAVIRPDGTTVPITNGTFSGNTASITLTAAACAITGQIGVGIQIISDEIKATVLKAIYNVELFETGNVIDPGSEITISVGALVNSIDQAVATIPAYYPDLMAALAPTFNTSTAYSKGQCVWYDGKLYQFTTAHPVGSWNADHAALFSVTVDMPTKAETYAAFATDTASGAVASFTDGADDIPLKTLTAAIEPVQDLHGYDKPWVGGGGKNLLPLTINGIKANNTNGTWSSNSYTYNGITFNIITDNNENITGIKVTGTASGNAYLVCAKDHGTDAFAGNSVILSGCPANGSTSTYSCTVWASGTSNKNDTGNGVTYTHPSTYVSNNISIIIYDGYSCPTGGLMFYPMIRLSTVTDSTFEPYSNICPITGWDEANVTRDGKNLFDKAKAEFTKCVDSTGAIIYKSWGYLSEYIPVVPGMQYHMSHGLGTGVLTSGAYYNIDKNYISAFGFSGASDVDFTITVPSNCYYVRVNVRDEQIDVAQFEAGSVATAYEPYQGQTVSVNLSSVAGGTVYGGTVTINDDGTGTLVVDRAKVVWNGSENWNNAESQIAQFLPLSTGLPGIDASKYELVIGNNFKMRTATQSANLLVGQACFNAFNVNFLINLGFTSAAGIKAYLSENPMTVVYPLANATIYTLTATQLRTLLGANNVWADCGNVSVVYRADTGLYIAKKIAEITNS